ncbi:MAG: metallophosphoesterase [Candidatus Micrarchaeota archaeon]|nr:metallophosphoesterase [Candidatus Micrarchaeota archaeon]
MLTISQLAGASNYMSTDNLIGLAYYLQHNPHEVPDMLTILGGALPEIPEVASKRKKYRLLSLKEGVKNIDDAAAKMKPHMERLFRTLPSTSKVIYVTGVSDDNNVDDLDLKIQLAYAFDPIAIEDFLQDTQDARVVREDTLRSCIDSIQKLVSGLGTDDVRDVHILEEIDNIRVKMRMNREELDELVEREKHLAILDTMSKAKLTKDELIEMQTARMEQKQLVDDQIKNAQNDQKKLDELMLEAKRLTNSLRKIEKRLKDADFALISEEVQSKTKEVTRFAHTPRTPPDVMKEIHAVSVSFYMSTLKDVFGRKRDLSIQSDAMSVYKLRDGSFQVNVIIGRSLGQNSAALTTSSNNLPSVVLNRLLENSDEYAKYKLESAPINLLLSGHHAYSSSSLELLKGESKSLLLTVEQGPFWRSDGVKGVSTEWKKGTKIEEAKSVAKTLIDSGAKMITIGRDFDIMLDSLNERLLRDQRALSDIEEGLVVKKMLSSVKNTNGPSGTGEIEAKESLEVAVIKSKRPSELKPRDAAWLTESTLLEMVPYMSKPEPLPERRYRFAHITDTHIGGHGDIELMKAAVKLLLEKKPDGIVFDGDILEGNRGEGIGYASIISQGTDPEIEIANPNTKVILNVDAQPLVFIQIFGPVIHDVVKRGGGIAFVSGNHANNTEADEAHDEAIRLRNSTIMYLSMAGENGELPEGWKSRIKAISGKETGTDTYAIEDIDHKFNVKMSHRYPATKPGMIKALERSKSSAVATFVGDLHSMQSVSTLNHVVLRGLSMEDSSQSSYVRNIHVPSGIRGINGCHIVDIYVAKDEYDNSRMTRHVTETILAQHLISKGLLRSNAAYERAMEQEKTIRLGSTQPQKAMPVKVKN